MKMSLKAARVNADLKQYIVCKHLNISKATLIRWEKNKAFPTTPQFKEMCKLYKCTADDIYIPDICSSPIC